MKRSVKNLLILAGAIAVVVIVIVANANRSRSTVRGIEVSIRCGNTPRLVSDQTVRDTLLSVLPGLMQNRVGQVNTSTVAEAARRIPYLKRISASTSVSGNIVVRATQRRPIMRLYYESKEYYVDDECVVMPSSREGACNVLVASGQFTEPLRTDSINAQVKALWEVAHFLDQNRKYNGIIDQLYALPNAEVMMVPKLGNHTVELGTTADLERKFSHLLTFYRKGMPRAGWDTYSRISLKYDGQVVCTKR